MALKVKNPKKNLADILIEKERLNESYDSSSAVSLKTLEQSPEGEEAAEKAENISNTEEEKVEERPNESIVNNTHIIEPQPAVQPINTSQSTLQTPARQPQQQPFVQPAQQPAGQYVQQVQPYYPIVGLEGTASTIQVNERKPWEEVEDYNPPRKKRGRPYQGYSENTHVQSIYVRNDLYEYIMINYVGHGRKHTSFNKFVNAAINNYLRQLEEHN